MVDLKRLLLTVPLILILFAASVSAQDTPQPVLCDEGEPALTSLNEAERIDDLTIAYQNDLGQQFLLRFSQGSDPESLEQFIAEARICFEVQPLENVIQVVRRTESFGTVVIDDQEMDYLIEIVVVETTDGVRIFTDIPLLDILIQTYKDMTGFDINTLIAERDNAFAEEVGYDASMASLLEGTGLTIDDIINEALNRAVPNTDLFNEALVEMGYENLSVGMVLEEIAAHYQEALSAPGLPPLQEPVGEIAVGTELDFTFIEELFGDQPFILFFVIDPCIAQNRSYPLSLGSNGNVNATLTATGGSLSALLTNSAGGKVDSAFVDALRETLTGSSDILSGWAKQLNITGKSASNCFTVTGTWVRY